MENVHILQGPDVAPSLLLFILSPLYSHPRCTPVLVSFLCIPLTSPDPGLVIISKHLSSPSWTTHHISTIRHSLSSQHMPICHQPSLGEQNGSREAGPLHLGYLVHYRTNCPSTPTFPIHRHPWEGRRGVAVQWQPRGNRGRGSASTPGLPSRGHLSVPDHSTLS